MTVKDRERAVKRRRKADLCAALRSDHLGHPVHQRCVPGAAEPDLRSQSFRSTETAARRWLKHLCSAL